MGEVCKQIGKNQKFSKCPEIFAKSDKFSIKNELSKKNRARKIEDIQFEVERISEFWQDTLSLTNQDVRTIKVNFVLSPHNFSKWITKKERNPPDSLAMYEH